LICLSEAHCATKSVSSDESYSVASGWALYEVYIVDLFNDY